MQLVKSNREFIPLQYFLTEYNERNKENIYRPVAVGRYGIRSRESIYSKELANDYSKNKLIHKNTLTVGMGSTQIDIGILTEEVTYSVSPAYHTYNITNINCSYLRYCLQCRNSDMFLRYVKRGSRQGKTIDLKRWLTYEIPVYNNDDQAFIVSTLDKLQSIISHRKQQLAKLDELVKGRFVEMFGDTEINNKSFPVCKLCDLCIISSSKRIYKEEQTNSGVPFLRIANLVELIDNDKFRSDLFISEEKYDELFNNGLVPKTNDILVTSRGTLGKCYIIRNDDKFYFQDGMISWLYNFDENVTALYLTKLFDTRGIKQQIENLQSGSTVAYLSIAMLKKLNIVVPPLELQEQFADFVKQVDKAKFAVQKTLDEAQLLFDSLMQEYFG